ncbi:MAG: hypothetical protein PHP74_05000 [Candidatus Gracilibacteria bacterium]|nr:hypothetical protein [Candidatus Gracilibacteria bacterium]
MEVDRGRWRVEVVWGGGEMKVEGMVVGGMGVRRNESGGWVSRIG